MDNNMEFLKNTWFDPSSEYGSSSLEGPCGESQSATPNIGECPDACQGGGCQSGQDVCQPAGEIPPEPCGQSGGEPPAPCGQEPPDPCKPLREDPPDRVDYTPQTLQTMQFFGVNGVHKGTGNYSETCVDMTIDSPGFKINFSRTYNSKDTRNQKLLGAGWTFGFEGTLKLDTTSVVRLPDGSAMSFNKTASDIFTPLDNRATLIKQPDLSYMLTTKDQYKYIFNSSGYLCQMKDYNDNAIDITQDASGKITKVQAGGNEIYTLQYTADGKIQSIVEYNADANQQRLISYSYTNNLLTMVTDPMGFNTYYAYDTSSFLIEVKDHAGNILRTMTYDHAAADLTDKLIKQTNALGNTLHYAYDTVNYVTTVTDLSGRVSKTWYDNWNYPIKKQDPDGLTTVTTYFMPDNANKFGEERTVTNRYGNVTTYERDMHGNLTKIINPDNSFRTFAYDSKHNKVLEIDERGSRTEYVYDANLVNRVKMIKPLNGTTVYSGIDDTNLFAITKYAYNEKTAQVPYAGLLKTLTSEGGIVTEYTYDARGNISTIKDPETGALKRYEYDSMDLQTAEVTAEGYRIESVYTKNRQLYKQTIKDKAGSAVRSHITQYDFSGRKIKVVDPLSYNPALDLGMNQYTGNHGYRYEYDKAGQVIKTTDTLGHITLNHYDIYGNVIKTVHPDGSIFEFAYDTMNRVTLKQHRANEGAPLIKLESWAYSHLNTNTITAHTLHLNATEAATTLQEFDYAGRLVKETQPNGAVITQSYYPDGLIKESIDALGYKTVYQYDSRDNLTKKWTAGYDENGVVRYKIEKQVYDLEGRKIKDLTSTEWVNEGAEPSTWVETTFSYYKNGLLKATVDPLGGMTQHAYDLDGRLISTQTQLDANLYQMETNTYNALGLVVENAKKGIRGDIENQSPTDATEILLKTTFTYDPVGHVLTETEADGLVKHFAYDLLGRKTAQWQLLENENGEWVTAKQEFQYNWRNQMVSAKDALGRMTTYEYDSLGRNVKMRLPEGVIKAFEYDTAGRLIREAYSEGFDENRPISEQNHDYYIYDLVGLEKEKQHVISLKTWQPESQTWSVQRTAYTAKATGYDLARRVIKVVGGEQYALSSGQNFAEKLQNAKGTLTEYTPAGLVKRVLTPADKDMYRSLSAFFTYDALGRVLSEMNDTGQKKTYGYDAEGNVIKKGYQENLESFEVIIETAAYNYANKPKHITNGNGFTMTFEYNAFGLLKREIHPADAATPSLTVNYQYTLGLKVARLWDSVNAEELYTYDAADKLLKKKRQTTAGTEALTLAYAYDLGGNLVKEIDPAGNVVLRAYDNLNRVTKVTQEVKTPNKASRLQTTVMTYDKNGNKLTETNWLGNQMKWYYDALNRVIETVDPMGNSVEKLVYNKSDASVISINALGGKTTFVYDSNMRPVQVIDPEGRIKETGYNATGLVEYKKDGRGNATTYEYDALGRLVKVIDALRQITTYTFDKAGNMTQQRESSGKTTSYVYGAKNQVLKRFEHGGLVNGVETPSLRTTYTYSADGKLLTEVDRKNQTTQMTYDIHGRLIKKVSADETVLVTYDSLDNPLTVTDSTGTTVRTYDSLERLVSEKVAYAPVMLFEYDQTAVSGIVIAPGEMAQSTLDAKGNTVVRVFDKNGRVSRVYDKSLENTESTYTYDAAGNQKELRHSQGTKTTYSYDRTNKVVSLINYNKDGTVLESFSYTYDSSDNQVAKTDKKGVTSYGYDALNRLIKVTEPSGKITTFAYDAGGNRVSETIEQGSQSTKTIYYYDASHRLISHVKYITDVKAPKVTISPAGKVFNTNVVVTLGTEANSSNIYYTVDGTEPSATNGQKYSQPILVGSTQTVKAVAIGWTGLKSTIACETYTLDNVAPIVSMSPVSQTFGSSLVVNLTSNDPSASIYYTTNGSAPSVGNGVRYMGAFTVSATTVVKAVAVDLVGNVSGTAEQTYTLDNVAPTVAISPASQSFGGSLAVSLTTDDPSASIYYTTNGSVPSAGNGTRYTGAFAVYATTVVKAVAVDSVGNVSAVTTQTYTLDNVAPTVAISPVSQSFGRSLTVNLTTDDPTASIYYTTNGSVPSASNGTRYTAPFILLETAVVKAVAVDPFGNVTPQPATAVYTFDVCSASCQCYEMGCQTCQTSCQSTCQNSCENACQSACQSSCQSTCEKSCQNICQSSCQSACQSSCQSDCQRECQNQNQSCIATLCGNSQNVEAFAFDSEFYNPSADVLNALEPLGSAGICANACENSSQYTCQSTCLDNNQGSCTVQSEAICQSGCESGCLISAQSAIPYNPDLYNQKAEETTYTYDANGNQLTEVKKIYNTSTQEVKETETTTHLWNAQNRLIDTTIVKPSGNMHNAFKYNSEGKRVEKTNTAGAKTIYLYEGKEVLLELDVNGNQTAKNIYGVKRLKRNVTGKDQYFLYNAHGDVTALVDRNGNVSGRYDYDAFGNLTEEVDGVGNPYKYAGEEHDSETGLYNLKARYYSPKTARFVSEDSYRGQYADPLSLNLYTYCHNEPMMYVDPSGHSPSFVPYMDNGDGINHEGLRQIKEMLKNATSEEEKNKIEKKVEYFERAQELGSKVLYEKEARNEILWLEAKAYDKPVPKGVTEPKDSNKIKEEKAKQEAERKKNETLDMTQDGLSFLGIFMPVADFVNGMISFARGKIADGIASMVSIIPGLGDLVGGAMKVFLEAGGLAIAKDVTKIGMKYSKQLFAANTLKEALNIVKLIGAETKKLANSMCALVDKVKKTLGIKGESVVIHGNSKLSTKTQHGYEIFENATGNVVKTGISGKALNKNGTSPRANSQVNKWNKTVGSDKYNARVVKTDIPGRQAALDWEKENAMKLWEEGNPMNKHKTPSPWDK